MSAERLAAMACLLLGASAALAAGEEAPDPEFLEYLGFWEESDEDWLLFDDTVAAGVETEEKRSEPVSQDEESTEKTDES